MSFYGFRNDFNCYFVLAHSLTFLFDVISISEIVLFILHATLYWNRSGIVLPALLWFCFHSGSLWHMKGCMCYRYLFHID